MSRIVATAAKIIGAAVAIAAAIPTGGTTLLAGALGVGATTASVIAAGVSIATTALSNGLSASKPPGSLPTFNPAPTECPT